MGRPIKIRRTISEPELVRRRDRWIINQRPRFYEARTIPNPRIQIQWLTRTGRNASIGAVQSQIDGRALIFFPRWPNLTQRNNRGGAITAEHPMIMPGLDSKRN